MMKKRVIIGVAVLFVISLLTLGLALPGILLNVQEIGAGSAPVSGPVSTGTVCVPYEYYVEVYYYIPFFGQGGYLGSTTVPDDNITQVYPGNFSADLPAGTNVSIIVYYTGNKVSSGITTLGVTLPAGNYTSVNISPSINSTVALNGEFDVSLRAPQYSLSYGSINLAVQKIALGVPTGSYTDFRVYLGNYTQQSGLVILIYYVYLDLRCYSLSFSPPALASSVFSIENLVKIDKKRQPHHCHRVNNNLFILIQRSPYKLVISLVAERAFKEIEPLLKEKVKELHGQFNTTNETLIWTINGTTGENSNKQ